MEKPFSLKEFIDVFRKRPAMYISWVDFRTICSFLSGLNYATGCLHGFREFIVTRLGYGDNLVWESLVLHMANSERGIPVKLETLNDEKYLIETLFDIVEEFCALREKPGGLEKIINEHTKFLERKDRCLQILDVVLKKHEESGFKKLKPQEGKLVILNIMWWNSFAEGFISFLENIEDEYFWICRKIIDEFKYEKLKIVIRQIEEITDSVMSESVAQSKKILKSLPMSVRNELDELAMYDIIIIPYDIDEYIQNRENEVT